MTVVHQETASGVITVTGLPGGLPVTFEDRAAPHQAVLFRVDGGNLIGLTCPCLGRHGNGQGRRFIGARRVFPAADALAEWRDWHEAGGIAL